MTKVTLYTGGGVTFSPVYAEGRVESSYVRLVADDGKALTNGDVVSDCVDVPKNDVASWTEIDAPIPEEEIDDSEALDIILGGAT